MMTKNRSLMLMTVMAALALFLMGCGGGGDDAANATDKATPEATVAVHDCDGDCGMKDVPMDKLTLVDGKYLCAGCVKKAEAQKDDGDHGHDHDH